MMSPLSFSSLTFHSAAMIVFFSQSQLLSPEMLQIYPGVGKKVLDKGKFGKNNAYVSGIPKEAEGKGKADKGQEQKEQARIIQFNLSRTAIGGGQYASSLSGNQTFLCSSFPNAGLCLLWSSHFL